VASSKAATVAQYLAALPADRRAEIEKVRDLVNAALPAGYREGVGYGMIGWVIPLEDYPGTYNKQPLAYAGLAAQRHRNGLLWREGMSDRFWPIGVRSTAREC